MNNKLIYLLLFTCWTYMSCSVSKTTTSKTIDIYGAGVVQKPIIVDLDVKETKVTGTATGTSTEHVETVKQAAVADALEKSNSDVLVEPKFKTQTSNGNTSAFVTGWPATYKNFRPIKAEDVELLQAGIVQKATVYQAPKEIKKNRTGTWIVVAILVVGAVLLSSNGN